MRLKTETTRQFFFRMGVTFAGLLAIVALAQATPQKRASATKETKGIIVKVDFDRDVRPILSETCFACHGPDANKRQANLRLDNPEGPFKPTATGRTPLVPGKPEMSELVRRITAKDATRMPPATFNKTLTAKQVSTLTAWVAQGAKYAQHWAFVSPKRPALPPLPTAKVWGPSVAANWSHNPIDHFILEKLKAEGLKPSPEADKWALIRRVTFDLTGLPPTVSEVEAFLKDTRSEAYEKVVERLLGSPQYGERMALAWLDLARYADTHGYHIDSHRDMWRWREWVIDAFNQNMPYDQFTTEQLAGDLLPNPTLSQKIATGFNRNHPINFEGGAIPEEYQATYIFDRIDTTATAFMGLTLRCAQCHDHKYDPFTTKDYYRIYAFFNSVPEQGLDGTQGNAVPYLKSPTPEQTQQIAEADQKIGELDKALQARRAEGVAALAAWESTALASLEKSPALSNGLVAYYPLDEMRIEVHDKLGKQPLGTLKGKANWELGKIGGALRFDGENYVELGKGLDFERTDKFSYGAWVNPSSKDHGAVLSHIGDTVDTRGWDLYLGDDKVYVHLIHKWPDNALRVNTKMGIEPNKWTHLFVTYDGSSKAKGVKIYINGKPVEVEAAYDSLSESIKVDQPAHLGRRHSNASFKGLIDEVRFYGRELTETDVAQLFGNESVRPVLLTANDKRTPEQKETLTRFYLENADAPSKQISTELAVWNKKKMETEKAIPTTMVMQEMEKPRDTFLLVRGQYDKKGEKMTAAVPALFQTSVNDPKPTRLTLAKWLVDPAHPLTARVAVNRYWQMYFGQGLVRTAENFGTQGERPTHPELLDWLATEFIASKWDVKAMQKLIVTSATYRQSSTVTPALLAKDPENRLLARAPRFRLQGEFVRDQALAVSGLLVKKLGGPSVKPYHPVGLWEELAFGGGFSAQSYVQDHGESLYRRSMYTFWKRTVPPPSLQTFDAPEREFCMVRRSVTNTPLQALVLMNDPTYVEASRKFAERILTEAPSASPYDRLRLAYQLALTRLPKQAEITVLMRILNTQTVHFRHDREAALKLLGNGESPHNEKLDAAELAAWTTVASVLLNLDETITKG